MNSRPIDTEGNGCSKSSDTNEVIDKWLKLLDERVEGLRSMAGTCKDLQDFRESYTYEMKADVMREIVEDLRKTRDCLTGGNGK